MIRDVLSYAYGQNVTLVAAAGNSNTEVGYFFPASYHFVISVASSDHNDKKSDFSNYGSEIDIIAPGGDSYNENDVGAKYNNILSLKSKTSAIDDYYKNYNLDMTVGEKYLRIRGTSMAAPHVVGVAALILAKNPNFTNEQVRQAIISSADDLTDPISNGDNLTD